MAPEDLKGKKEKLFSSRELDILLTSFAHEFRTPLNSLVTFSEVLKEREDLPAEAAEFISLMHRDSHRLKRLIDKFLLLVDLEEGSAVFSFTEQDPQKVFEDALFSLELDRDQVKTEWGLPPDSRVKADRLKLESVFKEILENANLHGNDPLVKVWDREGTFFFSLENEMEANTDADPDRATEKYYQGNPENLTAKPPGMGVGLYIARSIMEKMGGTLHCRRKEPGRWKIDLSLPLI